MELIDCVQFYFGTGDVWQSEPQLEDRPKPSATIKGDYLLKASRFQIKIRNIAGDETVYTYDGKKLLVAD